MSVIAPEVTVVIMNESDESVEKLCERFAFGEESCNDWLYGEDKEFGREDRDDSDGGEGEEIGDTGGTIGWRALRVWLRVVMECWFRVFASLSKGSG